MKQRLVSILLTVLMLSLLALPASSSTEWMNRGFVDSKGAGAWLTETGIYTDVQKPQAIRLRLRTTNSRVHTVTYSYWVECEKASKTRQERTVQTKADNGWVNINIFKGDVALGRFCGISAYAGLQNAAPLQLRVQVKY